MRGRYIRPLGGESDFDRSFRRTGMFIKGIWIAVGLGIVAVLAGIVWTFTAGKGNAESSAREWSQGIQGSTGVRCTSYDTDGDGYVSCTVFRTQGDPIFVECANGLLGSEGCRQPKAIINHRY